MTMKKEAIVLYPSPLIGHLISMVELGRLILSHRPSATVHILVSAPPPSSGAAAATAKTAAYISETSASAGSSISFHQLPANALPPGFTVKSAVPGVAIGLELLRLDTPNVRRALESISENHQVRALVIDFFCTYALPVARELGIPCYYFFTSGAGALDYFLYLCTLHKTFSKSFKDLDPDLIIDVPGAPGVKPLEMPETTWDREDRAYEIFLESAGNIQKADGVIVNSFEELEPRTVQAMVEGQCTPEGTTPPLYCIGPLISDRDERKSGLENGSKDCEDARPECMKWLDTQPSRSVIFLCFGSMGVFPKHQLAEIAVGLERSGQRFLWVVRSPPDHLDSDFDSLFPEGFLERTKGHGLVLKSWAPQVPVLNHGSVGGFVTHCGWNSALESVSAGVPMITWPLYAEQRLTQLILVKEIKIALPMNAKNRLVTAAEVEERVRELMDSEAGKLVREKTLAMKEAANAALSPGGSSLAAVARLVDSWSTPAAPIEITSGI